ncbi:hypothetical protein C0J52_21941, partial [Blattella germanica]
VTGGNKGIGYGIVKGLCEKFEGIVYLTARDPGRDSDCEYSEFSDDEIESVECVSSDSSSRASSSDESDNNNDDTPGPSKCALTPHKLGLKPIFHQLDVTDQKCLDAFHDFIKKEHGGIDILVNNAAIAYKSVPNIFVPGRGRSAKSGTHEQEGWQNSAYSVSKVGVSALSFIQQRAFINDPREDIVVNSVHPGYVDTDMTSHKGPLTIEQGADAPVYLALLPPAVTSPRGEYIWCNRDIVNWAKGPTPGPY